MNVADLYQELKSHEAIDGGPAFPFVIDGELVAHGMTMRDYFAAKAMQSLIAKTPLMFDDHPDHGWAPKAVAKGAVDYADALIAALAGGASHG